MARSKGLVERRAIVAGSAIALVLFGVAARPYVLGLSLVVRAADADADQPAHLGDVLELALFWGDLLNR